MLDLAFLMLCLVVAAALIFDYINGFHDTANAIATCVSTRALSVKAAIMMAATLNFVGAMAFTKVAKTIGTGIVNTADLTQMVVLSGVVGAIIWNLITWYYGMPSSSSHAIIGGLMGAMIAHVGTSGLVAAGIKKIVLALILSPILGSLAGFIFVVIFSRIFANKTPTGVNRGFRRAQIFSAATMAFSHGTADAQKSMGVITMALLSYGSISVFEVPMWVKFACALVMALGTAAGGWRIIKTVGSDFVKLQPMTGFSVDVSSSCVIIGAAMFGLPTSTTHVVTSSILGVGLTRSLSSVNWMVAQRIITAWILTIPASAFVSYMTYQALTPLLGK
jgi:inorganic phosphate transporter, PiT family